MTMISETELAPPDSSQKAVDSYSIRVASRLTGIPADTLRMWERRYGFPNPRRRTTGVRSYSHADVERLLLIARALRAGFRPGEVVNKSPQELEPLLLSASLGDKSDDTADASSVNACVDALKRFDVPALSGEIRRALSILGPKRFVLEVAEPFVARVRNAWAEGKISARHERLLASVLGSQIRSLLTTYDASSNDPAVLVVTLPGDRGDLGPEICTLHLALTHTVPHFLSEMPPDQIVEAARELNARAVLVWISEGSDIGAAVSQLRWIVASLPKRTALWGTGAGALRVDLRDARFRVLPNWAKLDAAVDETRAAMAVAAD